MMSKAEQRDLVDKLGELSAEITTLEALPRVLAALANRLRDNPKLGATVAHGLWKIYVESNHDVPRELHPICSFDDRFALARDGVYGTEEEAFRALVQFAESFQNAG